MTKHMLSEINMSGTGAIVYDPAAGQKIATVKKHAGFWEARCAFTGSLLLPRIEHTVVHAKPQKSAYGTPKLVTEVPLGEILQSLRPIVCA